MREAVARYEGTVVRVMGDGILALFGAPVAHEGDALRATYAALAIAGNVRALVAGAFIYCCGRTLPRN